MAKYIKKLLCQKKGNGRILLIKKRQRDTESVLSITAIQEITIKIHEPFSNFINMSDVIVFGKFYFNES